MLSSKDTSAGPFWPASIGLRRRRARLTHQAAALCKSLWSRVHVSLFILLESTGAVYFYPKPQIRAPTACCSLGPSHFGTGAGRLWTQAPGHDDGASVPGDRAQCQVQFQTLEVLCRGT